MTESFGQSAPRTGDGAREVPPRSMGGSPYLPLLLVGVAVLVQATLVARIRFLGACPNLLLVIVVAWSVLRGIWAAIPLAFVAGLGMDLTAGHPLGTSSLALMAITFLASLGRNRVFSSNILLPVLLVVLATPLHGWLVLLTQQLQGYAIDWPGVTLRVIGPELLLNVLLALLVYPGLRWLLNVRG